MSVRIGIGASRSPFETTRSLRSWLDQCEESRIDSVWQSDQITGRRPAPEPLTFLAVAAGATRRLKLGINAVVLGFRDPVTFARQCATLDALCDGRFLPVVGVGNAALPAWEATGHSPRGRGARADEALEVMTRLWRQEGANFEGAHYRLADATIAPRPVQDPLPLWIGGSSDAAVRRTIRYGNGWLAGLQRPQDAVETARRIRAAGRASGTPIPEDHYGATLLFRIEPRSRRGSSPPPQGARVAELLVAGDAEDVLATIRRYVDGGITKFVAIPVVDSLTAFREQTRLLDQEIVPAAAALAAA